MDVPASSTYEKRRERKTMGNLWHASSPELPTNCESNLSFFFISIERFADLFP